MEVNFYLADFEMCKKKKKSRYFIMLSTEQGRRGQCSSNPVHGEVYSIQHYVIKFVSDLRQVSGFLWILCFPPPIKLTAQI